MCYDQVLKVSLSWVYSGNFLDEKQCLFKHEEADVNIISYLLFLKESKSHIQVIADDTDIFMLLVYYVWKHKWRHRFLWDCMIEEWLTSIKQLVTLETVAKIFYQCMLFLGVTPCLILMEKEKSQQLICFWRTISTWNRCVMAILQLKRLTELAPTFWSVCMGQTRKWSQLPQVSLV